MRTKRQEASESERRARARVRDTGALKHHGLRHAWLLLFLALALNGPQGLDYGSRLACEETNVFARHCHGRKSARVEMVLL